MKISEMHLEKHVQIASGKSVADAAKAMRKAQSRYIYVTKNGIPLGVISAVDIVNAVVAEGLNPQKVKADRIMRSPLYAVFKDHSIYDAYMLMAKHNLVTIPVIHGKKLAGVLTSQEIMKHLVKKGAKCL